MIVRSEVLAVRTSEDVVVVRQRVRAVAEKERFKLIDQTKIVTAASELARNTIVYGGGGIAQIELLQEGAKLGIRVKFKDNGPGIADLSVAMRDGFTSGGGLGLFFKGAKRLSNEFEIDSQPGQGTRMSITRWR